MTEPGHPTPASTPLVPTRETHPDSTSGADAPPPASPAPLPALGLFGHLRAFTLAMQDPETPLYVKAGFAVGVLYVLSPIDLIPDPLIAFFGLGIADDAAVLVALLRAFFTVPTDAHKRAAAALNR